DVQQVVVILVAVLLEERRQVEQRLGQYLAFAEHQGDEQPPDAPVAVVERVDRLELVVHQRQLNDHRQRTLIPQKVNEVVGQRSGVSVVWQGGMKRAVSKSSPERPISTARSRISPGRLSAPRTLSSRIR